MIKGSTSLTQIMLIPGHVTLETLEEIYRSDKSIKLDPSCQAGVEKAAAIVNKAATSSLAVYGINTGFGKLASTRIAPDQTDTLQRNLIFSHCCGVGKPLPKDTVRLIMALKLISLGRGASGVSWQLIEHLQKMLNADILPVIPGQGSVGASGDLAPLAHLCATMHGEGEVYFQGKKILAAQALKNCGLKPIKLGPKEGLGIINGTQVSTALALVGLFNTWRLAQSALITGAMAGEALMASTSPFRHEIHALRGLKGQIQAAKALRDLLNDSQIREEHRIDDTRVQDPYCLRCQPQVMGACLDLLFQAGQTLQTEANAVTDNPLIMTDSGEIISGGNFHAEPVAFAADMCALAISEIGAITERRIATLVDPALNYGLPAFLSPDPGLNSGFMIAEVTAAALMAENKHLATPCSIDSTPTSANQEDHVSMACHGARRLGSMNLNLANIIAIEWLTAAQGLSFREPMLTSNCLQSAIACLRVQVPKLERDRPLANDIRAAMKMIQDGKLLASTSDVKLPVLSK